MNPATGTGSRVSSIAPVRLRHDDHVAAAQENILLEVSPAHYSFEVERQPALLAVVAPQHEDLARAGERRRAARKAQCLNDVDARVDDEFPGLVDLPDDVDLVAFDLDHRNGDDDVGNEAAQRLRDFAAQLLDGLADRVDFAHEGERKSAVRAHDDLLSQVRVFPY